MFSSLILESKGYHWQTREPLKYDRGFEVITVPAGFTTDLASVPRALWAVLPPFGNHTKAAVLHDYLYGRKERSRKECDRLFLEAMKALGVSWTRRTLMYQGVRAFGWIGY